jgi:flavin-dependent dehydrogenase
MGRRKKGAASPTWEGPADVLVIGAGTAGAAVAGLLAGRRRVHLVERATAKDRPSSHTWVSAAAAPLLHKLGLSWKAVGAGAASTVAFHSVEFAKTQEVKVSKPAAYLAPLAEWNEALVGAAKRAGARCDRGVAIAGLSAREDDVIAIDADGREHVGRIVVLADGASSASARALGMNLRPPSGPRCAATIEWPAARASKIAAGSLHFVLGLDASRTLALFWSVARTEALTVVAADAALALRRLGELAEGLREGFGAGIPDRADTGAGETYLVPAGHALEIESHVGKRAIAVGDAGGFVAAVTCQGVYPALWSAAIAAEVLDAALDSRQPQDELRRFDTAWRMAMAEYLQPPNADLQFLLPLVFSNKQMAQRLAAAFLRGENL